MLNRQSIAGHGTGGTRMGAARSVAGSRGEDGVMVFLQGVMFFLKIDDTCGPVVLTSHSVGGERTHAASGH
ncbi:hypothetical protein ACFUIY_24320 [Streptomyces griseorubiginosus]|uniref:hypothetical protein n=1 Tax=Streptomyces griseorubiginosus TaxID=67304 RepID=UPI0036283199